MWLHDSLPPGYPFLTFFPAVILTAFVGGLIPGVFVAACSFLASWYYFIPPFDTFELNPPTGLALAFFATVITVDLLVIHLMFRWVDELDREKLKSASLAASRDLMFQELQHRVSNNLTVVASLLRLQRKTVTDADALRALDEAANRLALIAKIQRRLHDPNGQLLAFGEFVREICEDLLDASGVTNVAIDVDADQLLLASEKATPLALIIAEIVSNSIEHAFVGKASGAIKVLMRLDGDLRAVITISDDGVGLPRGFDLNQTKSLGLLRGTAVRGQLGGEIDYEHRSRGYRRDCASSRLTIAHTRPAYQSPVITSRDQIVFVFDTALSAQNQFVRAQEGRSEGGTHHRTDQLLKIFQDLPSALPISMPPNNNHTTG